MITRLTVQAVLVIAGLVSFGAVVIGDPKRRTFYLYLGVAFFVASVVAYFLGGGR